MWFPAFYFSQKTFLQQSRGLGSQRKPQRLAYRCSLLRTTWHVLSSTSSKPEPQALGFLVAARPPQGQAGGDALGFFVAARPPQGKAGRDALGFFVAARPPQGKAGRELKFFSFLVCFVVAVLSKSFHFPSNPFISKQSLLVYRNPNQEVN